MRPHTRRVGLSATADRALRRALLLFLLLSPLSACSSGGRAGTLPREGGAAVDPRELRVRPGDRIALKIFQEEEMSDTFNVGYDGSVILPKLGAVPVGDRGVIALQDSLRGAYAVFLRNPAVDVTVLRRVGVIGEVAEPGLYLVDLTMTLRDVIAQAGGLTEAGDPGKIDIVRGDSRLRIGEGDDATFPTAELHSGDQVVVGRRSWIERNSLAFASTAAVVVSLVVPIVRDLF